MREAPECHKTAIRDQIASFVHKEDTKKTPGTRSTGRVREEIVSLTGEPVGARLISDLRRLALRLHDFYSG